MSMNSADESRFQDLLAWGKAHGASLHDSVEVYKDDLTGYSLRVKLSASLLPPSEEEGFPVVTCPATVTLSYLNALVGAPLPSDIFSFPQLSPSFPDLFLYTLPPHVIGRFYLVQQYLLGPSSFWYPYIRALPQPERLSSWALPAFWPEEDIEFLEGTNAEVAVREVQANVKGEFKLARRILKEANYPGWQDYTRLLYNWAFCMFTSRSFRPSTVLSEQIRKELRKAGVVPETCKDDDYSVLMPVMDIGNHNMRAKVKWDTETERGACQFVSRDGVRPGEQVFNNYGMKTNSELLLGYGFVLPETQGVHNDYIHVRKRGQDGVSDGDADGETKPKDFLISLRPMRDPSSVVGRSRQQLRNEEDFEILPALGHIEDSLVWDLVVAQAEHDDGVRETVGKLLQETPGGGDVNHVLRRILSSPTAPKLEPLLEKIRMALLAKMSYDYERILDPEVYEDGEPALIPENRNQELASAYRGQCKKVLETVIRALGGQV